MPGELELGLLVNTGDGASKIDVVTTSTKNLAGAAKGADINLNLLTGTLDKLHEQTGDIFSGFSELSTKLGELKTQVASLSEVKDIFKGIKTNELSAATAQQIDELNRLINTFPAVAKAAQDAQNKMQRDAAAGRIPSAAELNTRVTQLLNNYGMNPAQAGGVVAAAQPLAAAAAMREQIAFGEKYYAFLDQAEAVYQAELQRRSILLQAVERFSGIRQDEAESVRAAKMRAIQEENDRVFAARSKQADAAAGTIPTAQGRMQYEFNKNQAAQSASNLQEVLREEENYTRQSMKVAEMWAKDQIKLKEQVAKAAEQAADEEYRAYAAALAKVENLEQRAKMIGLKGGAAFRQQNAGLINGLSDRPELQSRARSAVSALAREAEEGGGLTPTFLRGIAQAGMASGIVDYRAYYAMNALQNTGLTNKRVLTGMFPGRAGSDGSDGGMVGVGAQAAGIPVAGIAAGSAAILGLAAAMATAASSTAKHTLELRNLGTELGITTQQARALEGAARVTGIPVEAFNTGFRTLSQGLEESSGRGAGVASVLRSRGIQTENPVTGQLTSTLDLLKQISNVVKGMGDIEGRDFVEHIFGRGGRQLLPALKGDLSGLIDEMQKANATAFNDDAAIHYAQAMERLSLWWDRLKSQFAAPLVGIISVDVPSNGDFRQKPGTSPGKGAGRANEKNQQFYFEGGWHDIGGGISDADLAAGNRVYQQQQKAYSMTPEGVKGLLSAAEKKLTADTDIWNQKGRGPAQQAAAYGAVKTDADNVEKLKKQLASLEDKGSTTRSLERERDKAIEGELFGYQKINREMKDRLAMLAEEGKLTSTNRAIVEQTAVAEKTRYNQKLALQKIFDTQDVTRAAALDTTQANRRIRASQLQLSKAQQGFEGVTEEDINLSWIQANSEAGEDYGHSMEAVQAMKMKQVAAIPNPVEFMQLGKQIDLAQKAADIKLATDQEVALNTALTQEAQLHKQNRDDALAHYHAITSGEIRLSESQEKNQFDESRTIGTGQQQSLIRGMNNRLALMKAFALPGAGSQAGLANAEYATRTQIAGIGLDFSIAGLSTQLGRENTGYAARTGQLTNEHNQLMSNLDPNDPKRKSEEEKYNTDLLNMRIQHEDEISKIRIEAIQEAYKYQEEMDTAHIDRVKQAAEAMKSQNEAAQNFAGGLIDAYMQAMLHRQSGVFPVREALGKDILGWGSKIGRNLIGGVFGQAQQRGLIPDLPGVMANDKNAAGYDMIDPVTGKPMQHQTALGRMLSGTPLGHHAQPVTMDKSVADIDTTAKAMLRDLDEILKKLQTNNPNSSPDPGASKDNPVWAVPVSDPTAGSARPGGVSIPGSGLGGIPAFGSPFSPGIMDNWGSLNSGSNGDIGVIPSTPRSMIYRGASGVVSTGSSGLGSIYSGSDVAGGTPTFSTEGTAIGPDAGTLGPDGLPLGINNNTGIRAGASVSSTSNVVNQVASTAGTVLKVGGEVVSQIADAKKVLSGATGKSGAGAAFGAISHGLQGAADVANAIPGGQVVGGALEIGAAVAAGISAIFGDPRADRVKQQQYEQAQNIFTAPSAYNLVTTQHGQSATYDSTGAPRGFNGPLLAYPNTTAYTAGYDYQFNRGYAGGVPGGVVPVPNPSNSRDPGNLVPGVPVTAPGPTVNISIQAIDAQSLQDRAHVITDAVNSAINEGHQIRQTIGTLINPH